MSQQPNQDVPKPSQPQKKDSVTAKPFKIREYVAARREKDLRTNWPFGDKYLDFCLKNDIKDVLPPFDRKTPHVDKFNNATRSKNDDDHKEDDSGVAKVPNEEGNQHNIVIVTSANFSQSEDTSTLASSNRVPEVENNKRRKRKGISKKRPMVDILAVAPRSTQEETQSTNQLPVEEGREPELDGEDSCGSCN